MLRNSKAIVTAGLTTALLAALPTAQAHCGKCGHGEHVADLVDTAAAAGQFTTLCAAVKAAGLVDTLKSSGPFTVFAPTDDAFAKLPDGAVAALLAEPDRLAAILKYHVVPGRVTAAEVTQLRSAKTVLGQSLAIASGEGVMVDHATVTSTDIAASNGIIHVIDTVLMPSNDIIETARSAGSFKTLLAAVEAAGLTDALRAEGPLTVFAPTDAAFAKLPPGTVDALLKDPSRLKSILTYHVVSGRVLAADVTTLDRATALSGQTLRIDTTSGVRINSARVVKADVMAVNGVIHVIDEVLLPPSNQQSNARPRSQDLIRMAIARGAPLYNEGHHAACAAVYEVAAMGLITGAEPALSAADRGNLQTAIDAVRRSHDASRNAWIMRHALDETYSAIADMN